MSEELNKPEELTKELLEFINDKKLDIPIVAQASCLFIVNVITTMMNREKTIPGRNNVKEGMFRVISNYMANAEEEYKQSLEPKGEAVAVTEKVEETK